MKNIKIIIVIYFAISIVACGQTNKENINKMDDIEFNMNENRTTEEILVSLKTEMIDYIQYADNKYSTEDVEKCINLIKDFVKKISKSKTKIDGLKLIDNLVIQLNKLNNKCEGSLIETMQREEICQIINNAGFAKGYNSKKEDTTEKLREW